MFKTIWQEVYKKGNDANIHLESSLHKEFTKIDSSWFDDTSAHDLSAMDVRSMCRKIGILTGGDRDEKACDRDVVANI